MADGPRYLVHQADGTTFGPADLSMLREWVAAGIVTRTTALSIQGDERRTPAAVVPGLFEQEHQVQTTTPSAEPMYQAHLASGTTDALTLADLSRLVEAGDVVPETPISLVGGSKKVSAVVVPRLFIKALEENPWTEAPAGQLDSDSEDYLTNAMVFGVTLVLAFIVLAILTKSGWPQAADTVLKPDGSLGAIWQKAAGPFRLLIAPMVIAQAMGSTFRAWVLVPGVWCMVAVAVVTIRSHIRDHQIDKSVQVDGLRAWWKYLFGLVLGIWYASLLSLVCFGPHPLSMKGL